MPKVSTRPFLAYECQVSRPPPRHPPTHLSQPAHISATRTPHSCPRCPNASGHSSSWVTGGQHHDPWCSGHPGSPGDTTAAAAAAADPAAAAAVNVGFAVGPKPVEVVAVSVAGAAAGSGLLDRVVFRAVVQVTLDGSPAAAVHISGRAAAAAPELAAWPAAVAVWHQLGYQRTATRETAPHKTPAHSSNNKQQHKATGNTGTHTLRNNCTMNITVMWFHVASRPSCSLSAMSTPACLPQRTVWTVYTNGLPFCPGHIIEYPVLLQKPPV